MKEKSKIGKNKQETLRKERQRTKDRMGVKLKSCLVTEEALFCNAAMFKSGGELKGISRFPEHDNFSMTLNPYNFHAPVNNKAKQGDERKSAR